MKYVVYLWILGLLVMAACEIGSLVDPIGERSSATWDSVQVAAFEYTQPAWDSLQWGDGMTFLLGDTMQLCGYAYRNSRIMGRGPAACPQPPAFDVPVVDVQFEIIQDSTVLEFVNTGTGSLMMFAGSRVALK